MRLYTPPMRLPGRRHGFERRPFRIFLAGSIEMGSAPDWQAEVIERLSVYDVAIFNPRRPDFDASQEQSADNPYFRGQVEWELRGLEIADVILMFLAPETVSPISLLELGLYARGGKLLVVCPEGFERKGNVDVVCREYGIEEHALLAPAVESLIHRKNLHERGGPR